MKQELELESNLISPEHAGLLVIDVQEKLWPHMWARWRCSPSR
jgi:hypothetical protein